jgi:hypothetical protein
MPKRPSDVRFQKGLCFLQCSDNSTEIENSTLQLTTLLETSPDHECEPNKIPRAAETRSPLNTNRMLFHLYGTEWLVRKMNCKIIVAYSNELPHSSPNMAKKITKFSVIKDGLQYRDSIPGRPSMIDSHLILRIIRVYYLVTCHLTCRKANGTSDSSSR